MKKLLIIGAGQHGAVVKEIAQKTHQYEKIAFLDDFNKSAIGTFEEYKKLSFEYTDAFVALGDSDLRMNWLEKLKETRYTIPVLIDTSATVSQSATVGAGTVIEGGCIVNTGTVIGEGCILAIGCMVDHNCFIGSGTYLETGVIVKPSSTISAGKRVEAGFIWKEEK